MVNIPQQENEKHCKVLLISLDNMMCTPNTKKNVLYQFCKTNMPIL